MANDFENILSGIKSVITTNLATKLTAIETEKGDSIALPDVDASAYAFQTMDSEAINYDPFIIYGVESVETIPLYGGTAEKLSISVVYVLADGNRQNISEILFRVQRALKEIFEENFTNLDVGNKITVKRFEPVSFQSLDSSARYKAIGIILETNLA